MRIRTCFWRITVTMKERGERAEQTVKSLVNTVVAKIRGAPLNKRVSVPVPRK